MTHRSSISPPSAAIGTAVRASAPEHVTSARPKALKLELSQIIRNEMQDHGLTSAEVGKACNKQPHIVRRWNSPDEPHVPNAIDTVLSPRELAEPLVRWQASQLALDVLVRARIVHGDDHAARNASIVSEAMDVIGTLARALADDTLTDNELREIGQQGRELIDAARELVAYTDVTLAQRRAAR